MSRDKFFSILSLSIFALISLTAAATAETWTIEPVASSCVLMPDTYIDSDGVVHVATGIFGMNGIKYLRRSISGTWSTSTVDSRNVGGDRASIALDSSGHVHIAYIRDNSGDAREILVHATNATGVWVRTDVSAPAYALSGGEIAIDSEDNVFIVYSEFDSGTPDARARFYCYTDSSGSWDRTLIASGTFTSYGLECSMVIDSSDHLHAAYIEAHPSTGDRTVTYSTNESGSWVNDPIDHTYNDYAKHTSIAVDSYGDVHISFYEYLNDLWESGSLMYATKDLAVWTVTTVDNTGWAGSRSSIAATAQGRLRISYHDSVNETMKYASNATGSWVISTVSDSIAYDGYTSMALDKDYGPHIIFRHGFTDLRHAFAAPVTPLGPTDLNATLLPEQIHVTWTDNSSNETDYVLQYKYSPTVDPGWHNLAVLAPNTTSYQYTSPAYSITYTFRVYARNSNGNSPYSNEDEVYVGLFFVSLGLESPDGGEVWSAGSTEEISWVTGVGAPSYIDIEYSTDGGNNWHSPPIATHVLASLHSYDWTVPATYSDDCILKIKDNADGRPYDLSVTPFSIVPPVPMPDLIVESLVTDPEQPVAGESFDVTIIVRNQGTAAAGAFWIAWYANRATPPTPAAAGELYDLVSSLAAGASHTMTGTYTYASEGQYNMYVFPDFHNVVTESDEDNNILGPQAITVNEFQFIEDTHNASGWFGGDDRPGYNRNVAAGQSFTLPQSAHINSVGFKFSSRFDYVDNPTGTGHEVTLVLNIRADNGAILETAEEVVPAEFNGGWVIFELDTDLLNDEEYIFTCYLQDGQINEYTSSILARSDDPWPGSQGYNANVSSSPFDMEDWANWKTHTWDYNFRIGGNYIEDPDRYDVTLPINTTGVDIPFISGPDTIAILNFESEMLDSLRIVAFPDMIPPFIPEGTDWVRRYYDITPYPAAASFEADITLFYAQEEFDASGLADESLLHPYRFDDSDFEWQPQYGILDVAGNSVFCGGVTEFSTWAFTSSASVTDVDDGQLPSASLLYQNYPNPFNPITQIRYDLNKNCHVELAVYDVTGRKVAVLVDGLQESGQRTVTWNGQDQTGNRVTSGVYFYRLIAGEYASTRKMVLLR
jgi:hypothetical protein